MRIEPFDSKTRVEMIVEKFKDLIISGELRPGDKLPAEVDLAQKLGTSRTPVREAIKILAALGVLEVKRGDGTYLCDTLKPSAINPLVFHLISRRGTPHELWELRVSFEKLQIKLAAEKRTENDLSTIRQILSETEKLIAAKNRNVERFVQADLHFHLSILAATHNNLVKKIGELILDLYRPTIEDVHNDEERSKLTHKLHKQVYECIEKKDVSGVDRLVDEIHSDQMPFWKSIHGTY
ncbi:MAG: FadR family transcriptional regulator [Deltaproteobacteria bacterium]|nr:FadR family transcriptional regulator [Deltaproteobacteria bacterium]